MPRVHLGATYDSTPLVTEGAGGEPRLTFRCVRGFDDSPEVRGEDTVIPTALGRVPRDRVWDRRVIELQGAVAAVGVDEAGQLTDVRTALEALRALFDPTRDPAVLELDLEDGGTATISARPINYAQGQEVVPTYRVVSVELEAVEADWTVNLAASGS